MVQSVIDHLKQRIAKIEGRAARFTGMDEVRNRPWTLGITELDAALPYDRSGQNGLCLDGCHDFTPMAKTDVPQGAGFILALLQRLPAQRLIKGPVIWCQTAYNTREYGRIYAPGLLGQAVSPDRFLFVTVPRDRDMALVLEECVRTHCVAAVVGEGPEPNFTASRRLTLAAQESHVPCLILNTGGMVGASAAATRWRIAPIAGPPDRHDPQGPGHPAWSITLARSRGADAALNPTLAKPLKVTWNNATHRFDLVSAFRSGKPLARPAPHGAFQGQG